MKSVVVFAVAVIAVCVLDGIQAESNHERQVHHGSPYQRLLRIRKIRSVPDIQRGSLGDLLHRSRRDNDFPTVCTKPNQTFMMDCNYCTCGGPDGLTALCTLMACLPKDSLTLAKPTIIT